MLPYLEIYDSSKKICAPQLSPTSKAYPPMGTSNKRRKVQHYGVEEVKFDPTARQEYLTGFRKRKQVRVQHAQKISAEKERVAKIEERKQVHDVL